MPPDTHSTESVVRRAAEIQKKMAATVDGFPRDLEEDERISDACLRIFRSDLDEGRKVYDWLRQITVNKVLGATATHGEIMYQEGMRAVLALIDARMASAEAKHRKGSKTS